MYNFTFLTCTALISHQWLGFKPIGLTLKLASLDCVESAKCVKSVFLIYLCHQEYIQHGGVQPLGAQFGRKTAVHVAWPKFCQNQDI